jgi:hypothetical protein
MKSKDRVLLSAIFVLVCAEFIPAQVVTPMPQVKMRWLYTYNGIDDPIDSLDFAYAIAYGGDGNLYAAGSSKGSYYCPSDFFCIISLDPNGNERWRYEYSEAQLTEDEAEAIVYGDDGNIYAAGYTSDHNTYSATDLNFTVISLDTAGKERWVYTYDSGYAKTVEFGNGNYIYAAGVTYRNNSCDFTVICLDTGGNEQWVYKNSIYGYANSIVCGDDGNIYVAGVLHGDYGDFAVVSLDAAGKERWVRKYDGIAAEIERYDEARAIVCGDDNCIYVAGTVGYVNPYLDFVVMKFDPAGNRLWDYYHNGTASYWDEAYCLDYGDDGNIYAGGYSCDNVSGWQVFFTVIGLDQSGNERWIYKYQKVPYSDNYANSIVYGLDGGIYAAGVTYPSQQNWYDFSVIALTRQGGERWVFTFDGTKKYYGYDEAKSIVYGDDNYLYIAGYNHDSLKSMDFTVISLGNTNPVQVDTPIVPSHPKNIHGNDGLANLTFCLHQNTPNPCDGNVGTLINYTIPKTVHVTLNVYTTLGQCVRTLVDQTQANGAYSIVWNGDDNRGVRLPCGVYICRLHAGDFSDSKKMILK